MGPHLFMGIKHEIFGDWVCCLHHLKIRSKLGLFGCRIDHATSFPTILLKLIQRSCRAINSAIFGLRCFRVFMSRPLMNEIKDLLPCPHDENKIA